MAAAPALEIEHVSVRRGLLDVVRDISLTVQLGDCVGLMGLNGAGKTSLLAGIAGVIPVSAGTVRVCGTDVTRQATWNRCSAGLALVPSGRQLFAGVSVMDNLLVGGHTLSSRAERNAAVDEAFSFFPVLHEKRRQKAGELSGGQQQMLAIARGLMARPQVLLLDEPSEGLAPVIVEQMFEVIQAMADRGEMAIVLAEQNAGATEICSSVVVLKQGEIVERRDAAGTAVSDIASSVFN